MKHRPLALILASLLFLYFPIHRIWETFQGDSLTAVDIVLSFLLPGLLVFGLLKVNRFAWYTLFGFVFLLGIKDFRGVQEDTANLSEALTHLFVYILGVGYFINPKVKRLYFDPKLRWWRTKERFETHGPVILELGDRTLYGQLKNISEGGCFVEISEPLSLYQRFQMILPLPQPIPEASLRFQSEVRWASHQAEVSGMGVQFLNLDRESLKRIKRFLRTVS